MSKKTSLAQFIWIGLKGTSLSSEEREFIKENPPGGVILFTRNYESPEQLYKLNTDIQNLCMENGLKQPAFIGIDMEGGRVQRLKTPFTVWPPMVNLPKLNSTAKAFDFALAMGKELKSVGINMDFSPCVDTLLNDENDVIGDRAFGSDPDLVGEYGSAVVRGFAKAGVMTCVKHFPGHGYSAIDSHEDLPIDNRSYDDIVDIKAFTKSLRAKPTFIMPGHLMFPNVDAKYPVPLSEIWIKDILLDQLNCRALIISDDLEMGAMTKFDFKESVLRIYELGFHQLLFCHGHEKAKEALTYLDENVDLDEKRLSYILKHKEEHENLLPAQKFDTNLIGHNDHKNLAQEILRG